MMRPLLTVLLLVGCNRGPSSAELIAREANPSLAALRDSAETVLNEIDSSVLIEACLDHGAELSRLAAIDFGALESSNLHAEFPISWQADWLLRAAERQVFCQPDHRNLARCARWCTVSWTELVLAVEHARALTGGVHSPIMSMLRTMDEKSRDVEREQATKRRDSR